MQNIVQNKTKFKILARQQYKIGKKSIKKICIKIRTCLFQWQLIYDVFKTFISAKLLGIMFDKVDGFFRDNDETKSLVLLGLEKNDAVYDKD